MNYYEGKAADTRLRRCAPLLAELLAQVLAQPLLQVRMRGIDARWLYSRKLQVSTVGFTPLQRSIQIARMSFLGCALNDECVEDWSSWDEDAWLIYEAGFAIHDYLHVWAIEEARALQGIAPELCDESGARRLRERWLLSEAAATVGLDFWCLSRDRNSEACTPLTTAYCVAKDGLTLNGLSTQRPEFFRWIADGYLGRGRFAGLDEDGLHPEWIRKELRQGVRQSRQFDDWLLATRGGTVDAAHLPVSLDYVELRDHLADRLWQTMYMHSQVPNLHVNAAAVAAPSSSSPLDFRFFNIRSEPTWRSVPWCTSGIETIQFGYLLNQYVGSFPFSDAVPYEDLDSLIWRTDTDGLQDLCREWSPLPAFEASEPADMFFPD